jgi:hypothetical protein
LRSPTNPEEMIVTTPCTDAPIWFHKQVEAADADLLPDRFANFAGALMSAEVDALYGAGYGERSRSG